MQMVGDFVDIVKLRVCACVRFLKLAKLMIVCCGPCQSSHIVTVTCVK